MIRVLFAALVLAGFAVPAFADKPNSDVFPKTGLLPKEETGVLRLLKKHPEYDGRNVKVAIFDTGVDPGAAGLQKTPDGKPKIVDIIDATGSGDVMMRVVKKPKDGKLEGLTGRTLSIGSDWKNPRGEYRLGVKAAYELFPEELVARMKKERRVKFVAAHQKIEAALRKQIAAAKSKAKPNKTQVKELETRLEQLKAYAKHADPGPVYDCVVFHDGKHWRAIVDTDEDGDLTDEKQLKNYRLEQQYATFSDQSALNFSVNIYENGKRLSIVSNSGAHGTHVAGIVAAHYPDQPELNGVAPGAQIVSVKIGDSRLGSMETGTALMRGLRAVLDTKCDLINMSYGEPSNIPNRGRLIEMCNEIVRKHGVIFVASAGNEGPALSTVGAPGGTTADVIGVGAYVSPQMMAVEYTLRKKLPGLPYTWTSRGPTSDGDMGVDIFAPGGAIAPVPTWTQQKSMRMNGTSMASPNTCGAIALLVSAAKATKTPYTPYSMLRAIQNTATRIKTVDVFAQGPGLIQVDAALAHLLKHAKSPAEQLRFDVKVAGKRTTRGIYLRTPGAANQPSRYRITAKPIFPEGTKSKVRTDFEMRLLLKATDESVQVGKYAVLTHGGVRFDTVIDAMKSGVRYDEIQAFDADNPGRGPLFRVPITRVCSVDCEDGSPEPEKADFAAGTIVRRFYAVPAGATWADVSLTMTTKDGGKRLFVLHTARSTAGISSKTRTDLDYLQLEDDKPHVQSLPVTANESLEVCLAQYWSSLDPSQVEIEVTFRGIRPDQKSITLTPDKTRVRVELTAPLQKESLAPKAELTTHRSIIPPKSAEISMLTTKRDKLLDGGATATLILTYEFDQKSAGTVTPRFPRLEGLLYDAPIGGQFWLLFDSAKRRIWADDMWSDSVKVPKGKTTLKLRLRDSSITRLERYKSLPLVLDRKLKSAITLKIYESTVAAAERRGAFRNRTIAPNERVALIVTSPSAKSLPKDAATGDVLLGTITYGESDKSQQGSEQRPGGYPLRFVVSHERSPRVAKSKSNPSMPIAGSLASRIRKLKLAELEHLAATGKDWKKFASICGPMLKEKPADFDVLKLKLKFLDHVKYRKERLPKVVEAADAVLAQIDTSKLATHFGTNINPEDPKAVALRKKMESRRSLLRDTLYRKGRALGYMELEEVIAKHPIADKKAHNKAFESNFAELRKWADVEAKEYMLLCVRRDRRRKRYGAALKLLSKHIPGSTPNYWYIKKRRDLFEQLGWKHLWQYERRHLIIGFPKAYAPF